MIYEFMGGVQRNGFIRADRKSSYEGVDRAHHIT